ncbi:dephospho-CoA kinase [Aureivirga marina]|uniref:dephospho-CoA kinase n=1 Tax=Aureivirga marina TaxID=1182451 RepID=UPI0018CB4A61|nr:dephospho-CoA kinase [Aureivirga marina]
MIVVGLTGGIGSGKSTVAKLFEKWNVPIYIADIEAKNIMNTSETLQKKIIKNFGENSYKNRKLNREYLANIVFNDKKKLKLLNSIVHPEVFKHFEMFKEKYRQNSYIIYENAILFENKSDVLCNKIIVVTAPTEEKIRRVMDRDNCSREEVIARMNNQMSDAEKIKRGDFIIHNNNKMELEAEVFEIHKKMLQISEKNV